MTQQQLHIEELNYGRKVYNFMRWNYLSFYLSAIIFTISIGIIIFRGFNLGLDFTGGMVIELHLKKVVPLDQIRDALNHIGIMDFLIQNFGSSYDVMVRITPIQDELNQELSNKVLRAVNQIAGYNITTVQRIECIGPSIGSDLVQNGSMALLAALICIFIYVGCRFEWRLAAGILCALIHDIIITLGILSFFQIEIDLTTIASLMSVIGYSLNDSIVVSDRIRENFRKICRGSSYDIVNISLTQTLNRTIITSSTTLMVVLILLFFGGKILRGFSITLFIGLFIGTVSSIYVASALALKFGMKRKHLLQLKIKQEDID